MITLLIVADDFTGALDTGVQLASCGAHTRVVTDPAFSFGGASEAEVLVIDAETRHLPPAQAAAVVEKIVRQTDLEPLCFGPSRRCLQRSRLDVCRPGGTFLPPIPERNAGAAPGRNRGEKVCFLKPNCSAMERRNAPIRHMLQDETRNNVKISPVFDSVRLCNGFGSPSG